MSRRIVFCNPHLSFGGIGTFTISLADGLSSEGFEVYYISTHYKGSLWDQARQVFVSMCSFENSNNFLQRQVFLLKYFNKIKPDIILINNCPSINYILPFVNESIKVISVIHSDDRRYYKLDTRFHYWIDSVVCPSKKVRDSTLNYIVENARQKVRFIPHGIDMPKETDGFKLRNSLAFVGQLDTHKGVDMLIPIIKDVLSVNTKVQLYVAGDGPYLESLQEETRVMGLSKHIVFLGRLDKSEVYDLLSRVEILVFPTQLESFGLVIPEAMYKGVIPVISNLEGITDQFIKDGVNGFLCGSRDIDGFSDKIKLILGDVELKKSLSVEAKSTAMNNYSSVKMVENYLDIFNSDSVSKKPKIFSLRWFFNFFQDLRSIIANESR